jgi:hypothetical protein
MTDTVIRPIETRYRGHRFRSRLEARWAVFFDAAGIEWRYEAEGFNVNGTYYLPDFWLPRLRTFIEVKPDDATAKDVAEVLTRLIAATDNYADVIVGAPDDGSHPKMIGAATKQAPSKPAFWAECPACNAIGIYMPPCDCFDGVKFLTEHYLPFEHLHRLRHALGEGQRARFEHGEDGRPRPFVPKRPSQRRNVYLAGAVIDHEGEVGLYRITDWRHKILSDLVENSIEPGFTSVGRFFYAGPTIECCHGWMEGNESLAKNCLSEVHKSHVVFCWIDRAYTIGSVAEVGAAHAWCKPIFLALASEQLAEQFYFAKQLATVAIIVPDVATAWRMFTSQMNAWDGALP